MIFGRGLRREQGLVDHPPIEHVRRLGGVLPQAQEIVDAVVRGEEVAA